MEKRGPEPDASSRASAHRASDMTVAGWIQALNDSRYDLENALADPQGEECPEYLAEAQARLRKIWEDVALHARAGDAQLKEVLAEATLADEQPDTLLGRLPTGPWSPEKEARIRWAREAVMALVDSILTARSPESGGGSA